MLASGGGVSEQMGVLRRFPDGSFSGIVFGREEILRTLPEDHILQQLPVLPAVLWIVVLDETTDSEDIHCIPLEFSWERVPAPLRKEIEILMMDDVWNQAIENVALKAETGEDFQIPPPVKKVIDSLRAKYGKVVS